MSFLMMGLALAAALGAGGALAEETPPAQATTLNETALEVSAPCSHVWEVLLDRGAWMTSFVGRRTLSGSFGETGELAEVRTRIGSDESVRFERILLAVPPSRLVIALMAPESHATAFADYRLEPRAGGCGVAMTLVMVANMDSLSQVDALSPQISQGTQSKIDSDLLRLKAVIEKK